MRFSSWRTNDQDLHSIGCEHDQDFGPPFSHVFKLVGHLSTYLEKKPPMSVSTYQTMNS